MSLVRIFPEQFEHLWEVFAPMVAQSLPPQIGISRVILTNILAAVLRDEAQAWLIRGDGGEDDYRTFVLTTVQRDRVICVKNLLIYALFMIKPLDLEGWKKGLHQLKEYARSRGCGVVLGFADSSDEKYLRFLRSLGMDTSITVLRSIL